MDAKEWYRLRNDRTQRIDNIILDSSAKQIGVYVDDDLTKTYSGQVLALLTINILARWCRRIIIQVPSNRPSLIPGRAESLDYLLQKTVREADPFGDFVFDKVDKKNCNIFLTLGGAARESSKDIFWADANGWLAGYGYGIGSPLHERSDDLNPVGACFAACQINSSIFKHYLEIGQGRNFERWYSLFNYQSNDTPSSLLNPKIPEVIETGCMWQVGCGAVGSSFDYLLSLMNASGSLHLMDYDHVSIPNTSSSLLFTGNDGIHAIKKIVTCEKSLSPSTALKVFPFEGDFSDFIKEGKLEDSYPDIVLCFANERNIWTTIQHNCPPLVFHATTSKNWGINFGRHIPFREWCIVCRFGTKQLNSVPTCANGSIKNEQGEEEILGILPFLAPAAAVQVLAEIIKLNFGADYPFNKNFLQFSMKNNGLSNFQTQQLSKRVDCPICATQDVRDYPAAFQMSRWL